MCALWSVRRSGEHVDIARVRPSSTVQRQVQARPVRFQSLRENGMTTRAEGLDERKSCITGADLGKILGVSKFGSSLDVWLEKVGESLDVEQTERMEAGTVFEPAILTWYERRAGMELVRADPYTLVRSATVDHVGATLDAWRVADGCPVDAKN